MTKRRTQNNNNNNRPAQAKPKQEQLATNEPVDNLDADRMAALGLDVSEEAGVLYRAIPAHPYPGGVMLRLPLAPALSTNQTNRAHIDGHLRGPHGAILIRMRVALIESHAKLAGGRPVHSNVDVLKWLLEQIGETEQMSPLKFAVC